MRLNTTYSRRGRLWQSCEKKKEFQYKAVVGLVSRVSGLFGASTSEKLSKDTIRLYASHDVAETCEYR